MFPPARRDARCAPKTEDGAGIPNRRRNRREAAVAVVVGVSRYAARRNTKHRGASHRERRDRRDGSRIQQPVAKDGTDRSTNEQAHENTREDEGERGNRAVNRGLSEGGGRERQDNHRVRVWVQVGVEVGAGSHGRSKHGEKDVNPHTGTQGRRALCVCVCVMQVQCNARTLASS